jgi:anti-sigma factor RsiW
VLTCLFTRRRIGAWLDSALDEPRARTVAAHVMGCPGCQREAEELRRLRGALQRALAPAAAVAEPDWTGF